MRGRAILFILILNFAARISLYAAPPTQPSVPYHSYTYGVWGSSTYAFPAYMPAEIVTGFDLGVGAFKNPKDLFRGPDRTVYLLDTGNKRILVLDEQLRLIKTISTFYRAGGAFELQDPRGLCLDNAGHLYVADRGAGAVYVFDEKLNLLTEIHKPQSDIVDPTVEFLPEKVLVDHLGTVYVLVFGSYQGAYTFSADGAFLGFFGANRVQVSARLQKDRLWRMFMTKEQRERMYRYVPVEYVNFALDQEGFIYTVSNFGDNEQPGQVRKLNSLSENILFAGRKPRQAFFGDLEQVWTNRIEKSLLVAVDVDEKNFINVLDSERGRVFQYDQSCNLIAIFGGPGDQMGTSRNAVDLVSLGERILVLDEVKGAITVFAPTYYGKALREATVLYEDGRYQEALQHYLEALHYDRNNYIIQRGIARAYERMGRYEDAMAYYRLAQNREGYSNAFREWRTRFLRQHFSLFMGILVALFALPSLVLRWYRRKHPRSVERVLYVSKEWFPFYLLRHPFKGWDELKREGTGSLGISFVILGLWFLCNVIEFQFTGFIFNPNRLDQMNLWIIMASTWGVFILWTIANWGICTLHDGKGTFREIWIFTSYTLVIYILATVPLVVVSNLLTQEEGAFLQLARSVVSLWFGIEFVMAVMAVHQYDLKTTFWSIFLTILGMLLIVFVVVMFVSLFNQGYDFISTIIQEILLRL
ncbi:YIP1 family protein [Treponema sp. J25]|uniref:YIP1 family protein n=1 Tax=Treponema sp. J25 TaxID=2094121 RepID=UPI0010485B13|nr:YIP1 family protein [Treponema sp. J25]TCW61213.1 hypothetical protein C5O22_07475 [Treponema sp. J25]